MDSGEDMVKASLEEEQKDLFPFSNSKMRFFWFVGFFLALELIHFCTGSEIIKIPYQKKKKKQIAKQI